MNKIKIIAFFGESGAGKDTALALIKELNLDMPINYMVSGTTRPPREYEVAGIDYHFYTNEEFAIKVLDGSMLEAVEFNDWFYGTPLESLKADCINLGVLNPAGIECLLEDSRLEVLPVRVAATDKNRLLRALNREENPNCDEIIRRYSADKKDFADIEFEYMTINNNIEDKEFFKRGLKSLIDCFVQNK